MRIANIMLGKGLGGIEQAFLDYCEGLSALGHEVTAITHPLAKVNVSVIPIPVSHVTLPNRGKWDWKVHGRLRTMLHTLRSDLVIAHGGRANLFAGRAVKGHIPIVGVAHNYHFRSVERADVILAITEHMKAALIQSKGVSAEKIVVIPNSIAVHGGFIRPVWRTPPTIGAMGRMVEKKGFAVMLDALTILKREGHPFRAVIAGEGEEAKRLARQAANLGLAHEVSFPGWIADSAEFLRGIDLFCLPSLHEPFGIVLLEAMAAKLPIVSTDSEGPSQILSHGVEGLLVPVGDAPALAAALAQLLTDEDRARRMASDAFHHVKRRFGRERVMERLDAELQIAVQAFSPASSQAASDHAA